MKKNIGVIVLAAAVLLCFVFKLYKAIKRC